MANLFQQHTLEFQRRLEDEGVDVALLNDPDNIYYLSAYWGYMGMELGRPTLVVVPRSGECTIITPSLEAEMARNMTWIQHIMGWTDGAHGEWVKHLRNLFKGKKMRVGIDRLKMHPVVLERLKHEFSNLGFVDITHIISDMRMVKSPEEIAVMRQAGQVAVAMCEAGVKAIGEGVSEYEIALAVIAGGTRKAAELLNEEDPDSLFSPMIHNLQALQSGRDLSMVHRRPTVRKIQRGDPVYMCFCEMVNFRYFKLGFDREFFVGTVMDEHARIYEVGLKAQTAALDAIRPGVLAEEVHAAALGVYREAGLGISYRTGRGIGYSLLEKPEFKNGDKTPLQAGMAFAVDGAITIPGVFGARVGDSIVVTENGFEYLTPYPKELRVL